MDIFENVLNKTKVAFSVAKNKTEEVVTVQKKKYNISTLENERNLDLQRLGFIYYKSLKNTDIEDDYIRTLVYPAHGQIRHIMILMVTQTDRSRKVIRIFLPRSSGQTCWIL